MLPTINNRVSRHVPLFDHPWMDEVLDTTIGNLRPALGSPFVPAFAAATMYESDDEYVLELDVPGFTDNEIDLTFDRGVLSVSGAREAAEAVEGRTYHINERRTERFNRSFSLPRGIRPDEVVARLNAGVLTVNLPKRPEAKPRRIDVSA